MTAQLSDLFQLDRTTFELAGISEGELFDPALLDLKPVGACTACYRGYMATFGLTENRLVLKDLQVNLYAEGPLYRRIDGPPIHGVTPLAPTNGNSLFNNEYRNLDYHLEYTGGLLLADGFIRSLYVHMGFHPAWKYEDVRELIFENGRLTANVNRSVQMAEMREQMLALQEKPESERRPSRREMEQWIERAFDRRYSF